jgi:putative flippase GtrA
VGGLTFAVQLGLLVLLTGAGLGSLPAYAVALALAVQFNFGLSQLLVWHDRPLSGASRHLVERWLTFHTVIALSLVVNFVAFVVAQAVVVDIAAAAIAVAVSTGIKFVSLDRYTFRPAR